ncbi:hypothetical protein OAL17_00565 [bacterium]|nr:hypothetical protein [bacterium]
MKKYNKDLLLLGAGYWGKNLARNFRDLGVLHTICDPNEEALGLSKEGYEGIIKTTDINNALKLDGVKKLQ